jgi:hypothetical protein
LTRTIVTSSISHFVGIYSLRDTNEVSPQTMYRFHSDEAVCHYRPPPLAVSTLLARCGQT